MIQHLAEGADLILCLTIRPKQMPIKWFSIDRYLWQNYYHYNIMCLYVAIWAQLWTNETVHWSQSLNRQTTHVRLLYRHTYHTQGVDRRPLTVAVPSQCSRSGHTDHCQLDWLSWLAGLSIGRSSIGDHNLHTPNQRIDGRAERWIESTWWSVSEKEWISHYVTLRV